MKLEEYENSLNMTEVLGIAKPCKAAPVDPVEELPTPSAQCLDAATAAEKQTAVSPAVPEESSPTTETAPAAQNSAAPASAGEKKAAPSAISGSANACAKVAAPLRPRARKMTPDEAKLWAEVSRVNTRLKQEMVAASFTVRALPGDLKEDAINILSKTVSGMLGDLTRLMAETGEP